LKSLDKFISVSHGSFELKPLNRVKSLCL